ncbi:cytidine deaminase [Mesorhizobium sp. 113-1-2]|uniref:anti-phage dCTP deaminase n=1 Tax=Mesorhizobium sp. 113-1-2 TaxID=2744515 RepID=UPI001927D6B3|nr:anti-phage dCTP deaminase [Mesorhizobium sp. 113-1-2]BCG72553.1 cytidine deaminase [Mesorhizobium sp. 113-1-2]
MASTALHDLLEKREQTSVATNIAERLSQELVIALVGPVGSGVSTAAGFIRDILTQDFGYNVCPTIKPSEIIRAEAHRVRTAGIPNAPLDEYITEMQTAGNSLRERFGGNYLAEKAIERIYKFRKENGGLSENGLLLPGRRAYIIDSLKNTDELNLLKQIYGETLCVFGVFAPDNLRSSRLKNNGVPDDSVKRIMDRDRIEIQTFGQKTRKIFVEADFFVCNDNKIDELRKKISRYLSITFNTSVHTPTRAESAMYEASSAAANSACMSRQVGAAIVSEGGELISVGWNDVPRFGGGLYNEDDQSVWSVEKKALVDNDNRCFKWGRCVCHNETRRTDIVDKIAMKISKSGILKKGQTYLDVRNLLKGTEIDSLIEFSRSIHAEMEAILSIAREGRNSLSNATLYTSVYPCHNCARHIVAAGITSVIYIEPYDKSLAVALHNDSVTEDPEDKGRVVFRQYDGVAPRNYLRLFRPSADRKKDGALIKQLPKSALPVFRIPLDNQSEYEAKIIADLSDKEQTV